LKHATKATLKRKEGLKVPIEKQIEKKLTDIAKPKSGMKSSALGTAKKSISRPAYEKFEKTEKTDKKKKAATSTAITKAKTPAKTGAGKRRGENKGGHG